MAWGKTIASLLALVVWGLATPGKVRAEVDLVGTWYVLIHYKDSATYNPDVERWLDKIWTFQEKGSRLEWTEYPIVVFVDQAGRFERYRGVRSRVLAYWQPNPTQMAQIKGGLEINRRGSKSKTLRGSPSRGYKSTSRMRTQSASVIGYVENWSIEDVEGKPIFTFDDSMGSGRTENMEGRTRYTTTAIGDGGNLLEGTFNRDGTRIGTFQLIRAGAVTRVAGKSKKVQEERQQLFIEGIQRSGIGVEVGRDGEDLPSAKANIRKGMTLEEGLQSFSAGTSGEVSTPRLVRKLQIVRLGPDGDEEISIEDLQSGEGPSAGGGGYGVLALVYCSSTGTRGEAVDWQVYENNALVAWATNTFGENCAMNQQVVPASLAHAGLERRVTKRIGDQFPAPAMGMMKIRIYRRALATLREGRIEDAEELLAMADTMADAQAPGMAGSDRGRQRSRLSSVSDRDALRKQLEDAISEAKKRASPSNRSEDE